jgi:hypothetical protein
MRKHKLAKTLPTFEGAFAPGVTIDEIRAELRDRLARPQDYDCTPPFMRHVPKHEITDADADLFCEVGEAWLAWRDKSFADYDERMDRRFITIMLAIIVVLIGGIIILV